MQREGGRGPRSTTKTSRSSSLGKRVWALLTMGMYALLTLWRLAIAKANGALLFLDNGLRRRTDFYHKVVLLGDGMATGFGAWVTLGALNGLVKHLQELTPLWQGIKTEWGYFERGVLNSTAADWVQGRLEKVMDSRACRDVEVAVVLLGLQDLLKIVDVDTLTALTEDDILAEERRRARIALPRSKREKGEHEEEESDEEAEAEGREQGKEGRVPSTGAAAVGSGSGNSTGNASDAGLAIVDNLRRIVEYLAREKGVHVCLCTLPTVGAPTSLRARAIVGLNERIKRMAASLELEKDQLTVVDLAQRRVSRPETRSMDGVHFTSAGYKAMAEAILDAMIDAMIRLEWHVLQDYVTGRKKRPPTGIVGCVKSVFGGGGGGGSGGGRGGVARGGGGGGSGGRPVPRGDKKGN